mmetsp:Transcript_16571/g.19181  ORF Transcript_16571/g.19181 Transcript_16571/m.19181 type:complete len:101 (-) Transcript_16571:187-489(-)
MIEEDTVEESVSETDLSRANHTIPKRKSSVAIKLKKNQIYYNPNVEMMAVTSRKDLPSKNEKINPSYQMKRKIADCSESSENSKYNEESLNPLERIFSTK